VYRDESGQLSEQGRHRQQLVSYGSRLLDDGLAVGSAGNMSVRAGDEVLITPSGIGYRDLEAADICVIGLDGTQRGGTAEPSSETPMHLAVYAATRARAVVHTHSPEVIALSAVCDELPAIHYAITGLGGPVRVAGYTRFGSEGLAAAALAALDGRSAAILQNHGAISYGATLAQAYDRALLLEWLAHVHRLACSRGEPRILTEAELAEVTAEMRRRRYGEARPRKDGP
jgi:L-fuculose-phosphate aldolase